MLLLLLLLQRCHLLLLLSVEIMQLSHPLLFLVLLFWRQLWLRRR